MLPVILPIPRIVSDVERLSDKALKPSLAGEYPGCKLVFRNSLCNCSVLLFLFSSLSVASISLVLSVLCSLFLVWTFCVCYQNKNTVGIEKQIKKPPLRPSCLFADLLVSSLTFSVKEITALFVLKCSYQMYHDKALCVMILPSLLQNFWYIWSWLK